MSDEAVALLVEQAGLSTTVQDFGRTDQHLGIPVSGALDRDALIASKIATVISADLAALGRLGPGATLRFAAVNIVEAEQAGRAQRAAITHWANQLVPVPAHAGGFDPACLFDANLISGVTDALDTAA